MALDMEVRRVRILCIRRITNSSSIITSSSSINNNIGSRQCNSMQMHCTQKHSALRRISTRQSTCDADRCHISSFTSSFSLRPVESSVGRCGHMFLILRPALMISMHSPSTARISHHSSRTHFFHRGVIGSFLLIGLSV